MNDTYAYTIDEFCRRHGIGRTFTYQEIAAGRLKVRKAGRRTLVLHEDAEAWRTSLPEGNIQQDR